MKYIAVILGSAVGTVIGYAIGSLLHRVWTWNFIRKDGR